MLSHWQNWQFDSNKTISHFWCNITNFADYNLFLTSCCWLDRLYMLEIMRATWYKNEFRSTPIILRILKHIQKNVLTQDNFFNFWSSGIDYWVVFYWLVKKPSETVSVKNECSINPFYYTLNDLFDLQDDLSPLESRPPPQRHTNNHPFKNK